MKEIDPMEEEAEDTCKKETCGASDTRTKTKSLKEMPDDENIQNKV